MHVCADTVSFQPLLFLLSTLPSVVKTSGFESEPNGLFSRQHRN